MRRAQWQTFLLFVGAALLLGSVPAAGAAELPTIAGQPVTEKNYRGFVAQGYLPLRPHLTDLELAARFDLGLPQMTAVKAAVERNDAPALRRALGRYLDTRIPPRKFPRTDKPPRNPQAADRWLGDHLEWAGKRYRIGKDLNWWHSLGPDPKIDGGPAFEGWGAWVHDLQNAYQDTGDPKYADAILMYARAFYRSVRPLARADWGGQQFQGPWHTLAASGRIMSGYMPSAYQYIGRHEGTTDADRVMFLKLFWETADFCYRVMEVPKAHNFEVHVASGLLNMGLTFPELRDSNAWVTRCAERYAGNLQAQMLDDGGSFERTGYNFAYSGPYQDIYRRMMNAGVPLPDSFRQGLERIMDFSLWILAPTLEYPMFGTSSLGPMTGVMQGAAEIFPDRADFAHAVSNGARGKSPDRVARVLWHTGWMTMRSGWTRDALYMAVNYNGSPRENDSDGAWANLNSFALWADGWPYMTDSGTTASYAEAEYRDWCKHTRANNTVLVDEQKQDHVTDGGRLETWSSLPASGPGFTYAATVSDAYRRVGVRHRRAVLFIRPHYWLIYDVLAGDGKPHKYNWQGHFQPAQLAVDTATKIVSATPEGGRPLWVVPARPESFQLVQKSGPIVTREGNVKPPLAATRKIVPYISLEMSDKADPAAFAVLLFPSATETEPPALESFKVTRGNNVLSDDEAIGCRVTAGTHTDVVAMAPSPGLRHYDVLVTDGEAAYVRQSGGRILETGLVRGRILEYRGQRLLDAGSGITSAHVRFGEDGIHATAHGSGEVSIADRPVKKVSLNGKAVTPVKRRGRLTLPVGTPADLTLGEPVFSTTPEAQSKAVGVPRLLHYRDMAVVTWRGETPSDALIEYREKGQGEWIRKVNPEPLADHRFLLSQLKHGATYELRITCIADNGATGKAAATYTHQDPKIRWDREKTEGEAVLARAALVAHYTFDEGSGRVVKDVSGNGNDGAIKGRARHVKSGEGFALQFNGADTMVLVKPSKSLENIQSAGAVEFWFRPEAAQGGLVAWSTGGSWQDQRLVTHLKSDGTVLGVTADGKTECPVNCGPAESGAWTHIVLTWDDKTLRGYRNGAPAGGRALIGPKIAGVPLRIGRSQGLGEPHFKGLIDDVKIYRRAISEAPARHHYEATRRP